MSSDSFGRAGGLSSPSRRLFVQGLAAGGAAAALGLWPRTSWAVKAEGVPNVLSGTEFDLTIGETPMNFTGATRPRSRSTARFRRRCCAGAKAPRSTCGSAMPCRQLPPWHQTSIHWHGILLPANMDGVPG
jgi:FtsP/CotA-like multicopper oxidase with cupredoxin domain